MRPDVGAAVTLLLGLVTLRLSLSNLMFNFVKLSMRPWLVASAVFLCVLGAIGFLRAIGPTGRDHHDGHDHGPPRAAWLLLAPVFALLLVTPDALGSFAADRQTGVAVPVSSAFGPLPAERDGAVELTLQEYVDRAFYDADRSLEGETVRLLGFVTEPEAGSDADFVLNRFLIACCAADARILQVEVRGADIAPREESWVTVTGTWRDLGQDVAVGVAAIDAEAVVPTKAPEIPYESL